MHITLSLTEKSARYSGCETEHQGRWPFWKSVLQQENGSIYLSDCLREKTVINQKSLEVCNVGNNSQRGRYTVHSHKRAADTYGLYSKEFRNIYLALVPYSVGIYVFPTSKYGIHLFYIFIFTEYPSPSIYHLFTHTHKWHPVIT